jgi:hypothetical protein
MAKLLPHLASCVFIATSLVDTVYLPRKATQQQCREATAQ